MAQIQVTVVEGRNLTKKDRFSDTDAFVEIYLDDIKQKQKTKVKRNSHTPQWNQTFVFNHLQGQNTLNINVYDKDTIGKHEIGSVTINLQDLYEQRNIDQWYIITSEFGTVSNGQIRLILEYEPLKV